jgi:hypothetical protein
MSGVRPFQRGSSMVGAQRDQPVHILDLVRPAQRRLAARGWLVDVKAVALEEGDKVIAPVHNGFVDERVFMAAVSPLGGFGEFFEVERHFFDRRVLDQLAQVFRFLLEEGL